MGSKTTIGWTNATWNPLRGCREVSSGCANCYAATHAARFSGRGQPYEGLARFDANGKAHWTGKFQVIPEKLLEPYRWSKPRMIFVNSMSDLFGEDVDDGYIMAVYAVMAACPQHVFQVLTKRASRMVAWHRRWLDGNPLDVVQRNMFDQLGSRLPRDDAKHYRDLWLKIKALSTLPLPNLWLGVSAEDQATFDARCEPLLSVPAAVHWVSAEPLLGELIPDDASFIANPEFKLEWVVVGGESGPHHRSCNLRYVRYIIETCAERRIPCFVKQLGTTPMTRDGVILQLSDHKGADWSDPLFPDDFKFREWPQGFDPANLETNQ
jgi:protein gp37